MKLWRLEAIRGFAALYVLAGHATGKATGVAALLRFGQEAVMIFFLVSGFVIEYSFSNSRQKSFLAYFARRFIRIYGVFIPMLIFCMMISRSDLSSSLFWHTLAGNLMMLQDFPTGKPNVIVPTIFASALWSLSYEWWFYMLYHPIKTHLNESAQTRTVAICSIASALIYTFYPHALPRLFMYFAIWWIGVEMARSYAGRGMVFSKDIKASLGTALTICIILSVKCLTELKDIHLGIHPFLESRHFIAGITATCIALIWQQARWAGFSALKAGTIIAPISYSIYITHQPLLIEASYLNWIENPWARYLCYAAITLGFCILTEIKLYPALKKLVIRASPDNSPKSR